MGINITPLDWRTGFRPSTNGGLIPKSAAQNQIMTSAAGKKSCRERDVHRLEFCGTGSRQIVDVGRASYSAPGEQRAARDSAITCGSTPSPRDEEEPSIRGADRHNER